MANALKLSGAAGIARFTLRETAISVVPQDVVEVQEVVRHFASLKQGMLRDRLWLDALGKRYEEQPEPPRRRTIEEVACHACHRLRRLRQGGDTRLVAANLEQTTTLLNLLG